tara:strand:+ start:3273 stop:3410 length:138 start_codon:yes stop_codon:yes gene_type:complete
MGYLEDLADKEMQKWDKENLCPECDGPMGLKKGFCSYDCEKASWL